MNRERWTKGDMDGRCMEVAPFLEKNDWRWKFLNELAETACVTHSAHIAGVTTKTVYRHRKKFPNFRRLWKEAIATAVDKLELAARKRALDQSDGLMTFLLKAHRPRKYSDKIKHHHDFSNLTDAELIRRTTQALGGSASAGLETPEA